MTRCAHAAIVTALLCLPACAMLDKLSGEGEAKRIRRVGQPAEALVLEIWDTNWSLNNNPIVAFRLEVRPAVGEPYEVETKGVVSRVHIPQVQPGAVLPVAVDPQDRMKVALHIYDDR